MDVMTITTGAQAGADDAGPEACGGADTSSWTDRLVQAASDYEAIDPEALAGLGCDGW